MPVLSAENAFKKGLAAIVEERNAEAVVHFQSAIETERRRLVRQPDARYLSYYGLSLSRAYGVSAEAIASCEAAARLAPQDPTILLNLGRVYALAGRKTRALRCYETGLQLAPGHQALRRELAHADRRSAPPIPGLKRSNPLNRWVGSLRSRAGRRAPAAAFSD
jgi:Flp pilus assembly protein TadD